MNKGYIKLVVIALTVVVSVLLIRALTGEEDVWVCRNGEWIKHGQPSDERPAYDCETDDESLYPVVNVIDGDTIQVFINNKKETIRLIGIDTPEVEGPYTEDECFGTEASVYAREILEGKKVKLVSDSLSEDTDKYDRLLRYVYLNSEDIGSKFIEEGYAFFYPWADFEKKETYIQIEKEAKKSNIGIWSKKCKKIE